MVNAIVAHDEALGIGLNNSLPWPKQSADLQWFKQTTESHIVVMGRKTWASLGRKLPNRINVVIANSRQGPKPDLTIVGPNSPQNVKDFLAGLYPYKQIWIIGGKQIYNWFQPITKRILVSEISGTYECDTYIDRDYFNGFTPTKLVIDGLNITEWIR